jgi:hypothetical protein
LTYKPIKDPQYLAASGTCTTDSLTHVVALAPDRTGYWWGGYQAAIPDTSGGTREIQLHMDGLGNLYNASWDEGGSEHMYVNHVGIHSYFGLIGPGNIFRAYANKAGGGNFTITLFLMFIPSMAYPH